MKSFALLRRRRAILVTCIGLAGVATGCAVDGGVGELGAETAELGVDPGDDVCWRPTEVRGVGTAPGQCRPGDESSGGRCYPACAAGYVGRGAVCWERCPAGYSDDGAVCRRNASIVAADNSRCPRADRCGLTTARGCSICPSGTINDGCACRVDARVVAKRWYGRGVGTSAECSASLEADSGLCYRGCADGFFGVGPVCWAECASERPVSCGAGCAETELACALAITNQVLTPIDTVLAAISGRYLSMAVGVIRTFNAYDLPLCDEL